MQGLMTQSAGGLPNLPYVYSSSVSPDKPGRSKGSKNPPINKSANDGVSNFFTNLISHVNEKKTANMKSPRTGEGNKSGTRSQVNIFNPSAPLITSDIYVAKPLKYQAGLDSMIQNVKQSIYQLSDTYRQVMTYEKPKLFPLYAKPDRPIPPRSGGRAAGRIPEEELIPWDFYGSSGRRDLTIPKYPRLPDLSSKRKKPKTKPKPDVHPMIKKFKAAVEAIKFTNYMFRLYHYQQTDCYQKVADFLKVNYPKALEEVSKQSFKFVAEQMIRMWLASFRDANLNFVLNKELLFYYGFIDDEELRKRFTVTEQGQIIKGSQPFAQNAHNLVMDLLHEYLTKFTLEAFTKETIDVFKILMENRTFFSDGVLCTSENNRLLFSTSGLPANYSLAHKKMILTFGFFLKSFLPDVFCQPELHIADQIISNLSRLNLRLLGSIIYVGFMSYVQEFVPLVGNNIKTIIPARQHRVLDFEFQFDRYAGQIPAGVKLREDVSLFVDVLDEKLLECYFVDKQRVSELKIVCYRIIDKIYSELEAYESQSSVHHVLTHLPKEKGYPHKTKEEYYEFIGYEPETV